MAGTWSEGAPVEAEQIRALMTAMGLNQSQFAEMMELSQPYVNRLVNGKSDVAKSPLRVLLRWLFAEYGIGGGRPPVPSIRVEKRR